MFRAIRNWQHGGRARHLVGLFAFEFVVIVAGVLTAQLVSDWSRARAAHRDMLANKERADAQIAFLAALSVAYGRVIPCMEQRIVGAMRGASGTEPVDRKTLFRPVLWHFPYNEVTGESLLNLRATFGPDVSEHYERITIYTTRANLLMDSLANDWESLSIVNPDYGDVGPGDRQHARILASRMRSTLRSYGKTISNIGYRARSLGVAPALKPGQRMPATCDDLWRWNSILYDPQDEPLRP